MTRRGAVLGAVLTSLAVHAALVAVMMLLPPTTRRATATPAPAGHVVYLGAPAAAQSSKLLPGDTAAGPGGPAAPAGPGNSTPAIVVPAGPSGSGMALGPSLPGIGSPTPTPAGGGVGTGAGAGGGAGAGAATTFFGVPARGLSVVYVVDRSASMGLGGALATARRELLASLRQLPVEARFQVIVYNGAPETLLPPDGTLAPATAANVARAAAALEECGPAGATRHQPALVAGLRLRPDVLFLLTDADDLSDDDLAAAARANTARTVIHTVELSTEHRGQPAMPMQRLARAHGGTYQAIALNP